MPDIEKPNDTPLKGLGDLLGQFSPTKWGPGAWGNGFLASLFLCLFLRCMFSKESKVEQLWNDKFNEIKTSAQTEGELKAIKQGIEADNKIQTLQHKADSLNRIVDSVNNKKT